MYWIKKNKYFSRRVVSLSLRCTCSNSLTPLHESLIFHRAKHFPERLSRSEVPSSNHKYLFRAQTIRSTVVFYFFCKTNARYDAGKRTGEKYRLLKIVFLLLFTSFSLRNSRQRFTCVSHNVPLHVRT